MLIEWCGENFEGVLCFDECHKAKNIDPKNPDSKTASKTGKLVRLVQKQLKNARFTRNPNIEHVFRVVLSYERCLGFPSDVLAFPSCYW